MNVKRDLTYLAVLCFRPVGMEGRAAVRRCTSFGDADTKKCNAVKNQPEPPWSRTNFIRSLPLPCLTHITVVIVSASTSLRSTSLCTHTLENFSRYTMDPSTLMPLPPPPLPPPPPSSPSPSPSPSPLQLLYVVNVLFFYVVNVLGHGLLRTLPAAR